MLMQEIKNIEGVPSVPQREEKCSEPAFIFSSSISSIDKNGQAFSLDTAEAEKLAIFSQNLKYWNQETAFLSANNFDNSYFKVIVDMGKDAVPFIFDELMKGPTPLVHALDIIFPNVMKYNGFVSLKEACDKWISILTPIVQR